MDKITIPGNLGMSGFSQRSGKIIFSNSVDTEDKFQKDVDNQTDIDIIKTIMIGPVYGHKGDELRDMHPDFLDQKEREKKKQKMRLYNSELNQPDKDFKEINTREPIGMIQFINKKNYKDVNEYDMKKFRAIQSLIGLSIDNTQEYSSIINIRLGLYKHTNNVIGYLKKYHTLMIPTD